MNSASLSTGTARAVFPSAPGTGPTLALAGASASSLGRPRGCTRLEIQLLAERAWSEFHLYAHELCSHDVPVAVPAAFCCQRNNVTESCRSKKHKNYIYIYINPKMGK